ncbi:hypothetical protein MMAN_22350 [Mycobacterium mantenii]|uniref:Uncharacterized protein n=1 Tax=Mycobacterium mantenii TaxID=560555 RepID=A0ABM7JRB3_MYCNT|nr:hypothetical protein MMAN_22350 [Mycobacterium mantenii]
MSAEQPFRCYAWIEPHAPAIICSMCSIETRLSIRGAGKRNAATERRVFAHKYASSARNLRSKPSIQGRSVLANYQPHQGRGP